MDDRWRVEALRAPDDPLSGLGRRALGAVVGAIEMSVAQPYLMSLMVGSLLLSIASFFTTFAGMLHFMDVWPITFCIVFAVQALLFVTSWRIGFALAQREYVPWFSIFVFAVCFVTSVFFSWVALFETINDEELQERTRATRIHRAVEDTMSELEARAAEARRANVEALLASNEYDVWRSGVMTVAATASRSRGVLEEALQERAREAAGRIDALSREKASIRREEATSAQRVSGAQERIARIEADRAALAERVERLRAESDAATEAVVRKEGEMRAEETGGADGRPAGRGPVWRELSNERNRLAATAEVKTTLFETARGELTRADAELNELRALVAANDGTSGVEARLQTIDQEMERLQRAAAASGLDGEAVDLDAEVDALRTNLAAFATELDLAPFNAAASKCVELLETMRANPNLGETAAGLSCDQAPMAEFMNPIGDSIANLRALEGECAAGGPNAKTVSELSFGDAVAYGRECIGLSGLPARQVADLRGEIDRLVLEEDPNASRFVKTVNAFEGGEKLSYFALAIAAAIDILVLFSGLIGAVSQRTKALDLIRPRQSEKTAGETLERALQIALPIDHENDPQHVRVARALLSAVEPLPQAIETEHGVPMSARIPLDDIAARFRGHGDLREEAKLRLVTLCTQGHATTGEGGDVYLVSAGVIAWLVRVIDDHQKRLEREGRAPRRRKTPVSPDMWGGGAGETIARLPAGGRSALEQMGGARRVVGEGRSFAETQAAALANAPERRTGERRTGDRRAGDGSSGAPRDALALDPATAGVGGNVVQLPAPAGPYARSPNTAEGGSAFTLSPEDRAEPGFSGNDVDASREAEFDEEPGFSPDVFKANYMSAVTQAAKTTKTGE